MLDVKIKRIKHRQIHATKTLNEQPGYCGIGRVRDFESLATLGITDNFPINARTACATVVLANSPADRLIKSAQTPVPASIYLSVSKNPNGVGRAVTCIVVGVIFSHDQPALIVSGVLGQFTDQLVVSIGQSIFSWKQGCFYGKASVLWVHCPPGPGKGQYAGKVEVNFVVFVAEQYICDTQCFCAG